MKRRRSRFARLAVLPLLAVSINMVVGAGTAAAWCESSSKWLVGAGHDVWPSPAIPAAYQGSIKNGITGWNGVANSTFSFAYVTPGTQGPPAKGGYVWMNSSGTNFPGFGGAPGVTITKRNGAGTIYWAESWLNPAFTWNGVGTMNQAQKKADLTTVTLHEMGHWLTLLHPNACGAMTAAEIAAVMWPNWTTKWSLQPDDRAGSASMY